MARQEQLVTTLPAREPNAEFGVRRLLQAERDLSLARRVDAVSAIVPVAARELVGADGAAFVLRDADSCHYVDEDAIEPLWKGQRFPVTACIGGWTMLNRQAASIEDVYTDTRISADVYRPTFIKSLVMVPVGIDNPLGALGTYWAQRHRPSPSEVDLLQALANSSAAALDNVRARAELDRVVSERTKEMEAANRDLESYLYSAFHDLKAPLINIKAYLELIALEEGDLGASATEKLERIKCQAARMGAVIDDLLRLAKLSTVPLTRAAVDVSGIASRIVSRLQSASPERKVSVRVQPALVADGDEGLLRIALEHLLSNAWKFTTNRSAATIEVGGGTTRDGAVTIFVRDNGAGFDAQHASQLFVPFRRLHSAEQFDGAGVGLATVQRIIRRHGGHVRAEGVVNQGATFSFTLAGTRNDPESIVAGRLRREDAT